jgi:hypothetical protein
VESNRTMVNLEVGEDLIDALVADRRLPDEEAGDKAAIARALSSFIAVSLALRRKGYR